jgi:hypothetical protein
MKLYAEETINLCRLILNRTGYAGAPSKIVDEGRAWVFEILSNNRLIKTRLDGICRDTQIDPSELDYYYKQCEIRVDTYV